MPIYFNSKSTEWGWMSNFYSSPILLEQKDYPTVEHWFQSHKFGNQELQEKIRSAKSPAQAKKLGRTRDESFRKDWESVKEEILYKGLKAKFEQNIQLLILLQETRSEQLIEQSPWDSYWGSGKTGNGKNRMGYLLMKVRDELS